MKLKRYMPVLIVLTIMWIVGPTSVHAAGATFVVTTAADGDDTDIMDGLCKTAAGPCSLRAAIQQANNMIEPATITFAIGTGAQSLSYASPLPEITAAMTIDATTQPGFAGQPIITLDGANVPEAYETLDAGFYVTGGNTTIKGFIIIRFVEGGIVLHDNGFNRIQGNYIGTNGNAAYGNPDNGIQIENSTNNLIGGTNTADRNVISGNSWDGIAIDEGSSNTRVQGNIIGLNAAGTAAVPNGSYGIDVYGFSVDSNNVVIGGPEPNAGNIISGNGRTGIHVYAGLTYGRINDLVIWGNHIGTDITGAQDRGNVEDGLFISNTVNTLLRNNLISGNNENGIRLSETQGTVIQGNYIGTNAAGTAAIGNTQDGVEIYNYASNVLIGGTAEGEGNVIGGNGNHGIYLIEAITPTIQGNLIGVGPQGAAIGNQYSGVYISDTVDSISVGDPDNPNAIAYNNEAGISVFGTSNAIRGNAIFDNFRIGIDLLIPNKLFDDKGVSANDPGDGDTGGNNMQNYPVLSAAQISGSTVSITGTLNSTASETFTLDFYANPVCDPSGHGEGMFYLGALAGQPADSSGNLSFTASLPMENTSLQYITATATDSANNTSEFSACVVASGATAPETQTPVPTDPPTTETPTPEVPVNEFVPYAPSNGADITGASQYTPNFQWQHMPDAEWYNIWITSADYSAFYVPGAWYPATDAIGQAYGQTGICQDGICTLPDDVWIAANGDYIWWVAYWNPTIGENYVQTYQSSVFSVNMGQATSLENVIPAGLTATNPLTLQWTANESVLWYRVWLGLADYSNMNGDLFGWVRADEICSNETCQIPVPTDLALEDYEWWMELWGPGGYTPWIKVASFQIES